MKSSHMRGLQFEAKYAAAFQLQITSGCTSDHHFAPGTAPGPHDPLYPPPSTVAYTRLHVIAACVTTTDRGARRPYQQVVVCDTNLRSYQESTTDDRQTTYSVNFVLRYRSSDRVLRLIMAVGWWCMLVAFLIGLATEVPLVAAEGPPSATMRFMEQVHGHYRASEDDREAQQLYVSKRALVEDRACRRLHKTPHAIAGLWPPWFISTADLAEGFWSTEVAALSC